LRVLNIDIKQIQEQVNMTRDRKFAGFAFFFYESLGDRDESFQAMLPDLADRPGRIAATRVAAPAVARPPESTEQRDREARIQRRERRNRPGDR
jgi:uncharacterized lipoprotein YddW (UPF0748 family)